MRNASKIIHAIEVLIIINSKMVSRKERKEYRKERNVFLSLPRESFRVVIPTTLSISSDFGHQTSDKEIDSSLHSEFAESPLGNDNKKHQ